MARVAARIEAGVGFKVTTLALDLEMVSLVHIPQFYVLVPR